MTVLAQLAALLAIVITGVVYGTDAFFALVARRLALRLGRRVRADGRIRP